MPYFARSGYEREAVFQPFFETLYARQICSQGLAWDGARHRFEGKVGSDDINRTAPSSAAGDAGVGIGAPSPAVLEPMAHSSVTPSGNGDPSRSARRLHRLKTKNVKSDPQTLVMNAGASGAGHCQNTIFNMLFNADSMFARKLENSR